MEEINAVGRMEHCLRTKSLSELTKETHYEITKMSILTTLYGPRLIVEVNEDFKAFLPTRFVKMFQTDQDYFEKMQELAKSKKLQMKYIGGKYNDVEFKLK